MNESRAPNGEHDERIERARQALESGMDERKVQALWRRIGSARSQARQRRTPPTRARAMMVAAARMASACSVRTRSSRAMALAR